jgi:hypothetical protein
MSVNFLSTVENLSISSVDFHILFIPNGELSKPGYTQCGDLVKTRLMQSFGVCTGTTPTSSLFVDRNPNEGTSASHGMCKGFWVLGFAVHFCEGLVHNLIFVMHIILEQPIRLERRFGPRVG